METETRRERHRRTLVDEIVNEARSLLEQGGPSSVSLRAIARTVGMSAPSLYTYFPSLNDVFTELIVRSYDALADHVVASLEACSDAALSERLLAGPLAYRGWALANRQQFNLIFFDQIAGYEAPVDGPTVDAQTSVLRPMAEDYATACGESIETLLEPGDLFDDFLGWWGMFHGLVVLEVNHHLDWVDAGVVFERRLRRDIDQLTSTASS